MIKFTKSALLLSAASTLCFAGLAQAQVTTGEVGGVVTTETGAPISGATITVTNTDTGFTRTVRSNSDGQFAVRNLNVTGLYDILVAGDGYQGERVEDIALSLGGTTSLNFDLAGGTSADEIIVVGQRMVLADVAVGPSASFGLATIENAPAINRNIADIIRLDPRVYIDESRGDINSVQCVGQSSRFNSVTLDGVTMNDAFGLNSNGYPTERMPFPFDAIEQVSVEIAPFDVKYGGFTACNINSVTKSGTNEIHGGAFFDYTSDDLRGGSVDGVDTNFNDFSEKRYGINVGGPIIKDKLFFHVAYEKLEGANTFNTAQTIGTGAFQVSQAELDRISEISNRVYQYDPGTTPESFANADEKVLVKLDWNINEKHRAAATYNYNDGFNTVRSDGDSDEFEFSNHLYNRGSKLQSISGALYSDWSENFSTEVRVGYLDFENDVRSVGGNDFGEVQIRTPRGVTVYLGGDDSRQSNKLIYDQLDLSFRANYDWNNHSFLFGAERRDLDIFNLFVQHTETELRFNGIDEFENGLVDRIYYNNAPSQNPDDAAADWGYAINSIYAQDEIQLSDTLSVIGGLRYDWYSTSDLPTENPGFLAEYGFSNSQTLDGESLIQPRLALTWDVSDELQIRAGAGRYSGGNPNVWLSNNYSANNIDQVGALARAGRGGQPNPIDLFAQTYSGAEDGVPNFAGYAIPDVVYDAVGTGVGSNFELNYLDPNFKIPSDWKYSIGATWSPDFNTGENLFGGIWTFQGDLLISKSSDTALVKRADLVETGTRVVDGVTYPTYSSPNQDAFVLTNAEVGNEAFVASLGISRDWDSGWAASFGYAYSDAKDVSPMTSSVAFSNYNNRAFLDPQEEVLATSNYNIKHRFSGSVSYTKDFWKDYDTRVFAFFQSSTGRPYSMTQNGVGNSIYSFTPFLGNNGNSILLPGTERNQFTGPSWTKVDLKISQDLPGLRSEDRAQVFMVIDNLTNLLNDEWGKLENPGFPRTLVPGQPFQTSIDASAYEIRFGASYDF
ncbi:MAG: TonB-dependent receptor [Hyphomonadaceae bacterium]|nr:TonB-dependent receptor [Hyphomonadaceae bacterium]